MLFNPDYEGWFGILYSVLMGRKAIPVWMSLPSVSTDGFAHLLAYVHMQFLLLFLALYAIRISRFSWH